MKFANDYSCITGGQCISTVRSSGEETEMGKFGVRLVYVNVGLLEKLSSDYGSGSLDHRRALFEVVDNMREQIEVEPNAAEEAMVKIMRLKSLILSSSHLPISYPSIYS